VLLCHTCHTYAHRYPTIAGGVGFIVSRFENTPSSVPVHSAQGWAVMTCDGYAIWVPEHFVVMEDGVPFYAGPPVE
jgi:hypothetical protein